MLPYSAIHGVNLSITALIVRVKLLDIDYLYGQSCMTNHGVYQCNSLHGSRLIINSLITLDTCIQSGVGALESAETLYHRDDALLFITYVMLIWAAPIPADRWHCSLWQLLTPWVDWHVPW